MWDSRASESKADVAYKSLKQMVVEGEILPLQRLHAKELGERIGFGPTPIREALLQLHAEGFIVANHNKGFTARLLSLKEFADIYDFALLAIRHAVEGCVSGLPDATAHLLQVADCALTGEGNPRTYALSIENLYLHLGRLSDNSAILASLGHFNKVTHLVRVVDLETDDRMDEVKRDMHSLVMALRNGSIRLASETLSVQFEKKKQRLPHLVREIIARVHGVYTSSCMCAVQSTSSRGDRSLGDATVNSNTTRYPYS